MLITPVIPHRLLAVDNILTEEGVKVYGKHIFIRCGGNLYSDDWTCHLICNCGACSVVKVDPTEWYGDVFWTCPKCGWKNKRIITKPPMAKGEKRTFQLDGNFKMIEMK